MAADLEKTERRWLRDAEERLDFAGLAVLDQASMRTARLAYRLLIREP